MPRMAGPVWGSSNGVSLIRMNTATRTPTAKSAWPSFGNPSDSSRHVLCQSLPRGVEQLVAQQVHDLEIAGSIPAPAIRCRLGRPLRRRPCAGSVVVCIFDKLIAIRR
jgi:hypothetical protein